MVSAATHPAGIRDLFHPSRLAATTLLGAAIGLEALEFYVTTSLMPSMVRDIGGLSLLAWTASLFVAAVVLGSIAVVIRPKWANLNHVYIAGALSFAVGCAIVGLAPEMITVLIGRVVQGFGAGLLVTMGYSFIRFVYPEGMQNAASAFYSALWGVSTLLGPTLGGLFANGGMWRWAFLILIPLALIMALAAPKLLPPGEEERVRQPVPFVQIGLIIAAILLVSFAGTAQSDTARIALMLTGAAGLIGFIASERLLSTRLLPHRTTFIRDPICQTYFAMAMLIAVLNSDVYIPYFLQVLHGISPLVSGYIVALVATGWTAMGLLTASWRGRAARTAILVGPFIQVTAVLLLAFALGRSNPEADIGIIVAICVCLFGIGMGIGVAWAHLVSIALTGTGEDETDKAGPAINLIQSLAASFGAALAGVIANSAGLVAPGGIEGGVPAVIWLYGLTSIAAFLAIFAVVPLFRRED